MILTIDTGATKTLVTTFDRSGKPGKETKFETPHNTDDYIDALKTVIAKFEIDQFDAIVIAVPGVVKNGVVMWCGNLPWKNFALKKIIEETYSCPVFIENDASLAGLAEVRLLNRTPELCLYLTISTGIGGGILVNGKLIPELSDCEPGHILLQYEGSLAAWEDYASGSAIKRNYGKFAYEITSKHIWNEIAENIATGLLVLIPTLQPDDIIIGGSIGTHYSKYDDELKSIIDSKLSKKLARPNIHQAKHPQEAVIYGCYYYGVDKLTH